MSEWWWKLTGKPAVKATINGWRMRGYTNEKILNLLKTSKIKFDKKQIEYAKKILQEDWKDEKW